MFEREDRILKELCFWERRQKMNFLFMLIVLGSGIALAEKIGMKLLPGIMSLIIMSNVVLRELETR